MKIKIKTTNEYKQQKYLTLFIALLFFPILSLIFYKLLGLNSFFNDLFKVPVEFISNNLWFIIILGISWLAFSTANLYNYISAKKLPNEKKFSEICFNNHGITVARKNDFLDYSYKDIESLKIILTTEYTYVTAGRMTNRVVKIERIDLHFKMISNEKTLKINLCGKISWLFQILNYHKYFKKFDYEIIGPQIDSYGDLSKKINTYMLKGKKELFPKENVPIIYFLATIIFINSIIMFIQMRGQIIKAPISAIGPVGVLLFSITCFGMLEFNRRHY